MEITKAEDVLMHDHALNAWKHGVVTLRHLTQDTAFQTVTMNSILQAAKVQDITCNLVCVTTTAPPPTRQWEFRVHKIDFIGFIGGIISVQPFHQVPIWNDGVVPITTSPVPQWTARTQDQIICYGTGNNRPHHTIELPPDICNVTDDAVIASGTPIALNRPLANFMMVLPAAFIANDDSGYIKFHYSFKPREFFNITGMNVLDDFRDIGVGNKVEEKIKQRVRKRDADFDKIRKIRKIKQLTLPVIDK